MGEERNQSPIGKESLLAQVLDRNNLIRALKQVKRNKGAAGVNGMTVEELPDYLTQRWPEIKSHLLSGHYRPQAVKRVEIPKPDGRKRKLGIQTVIDRFIQQAIAQVLAPIWEPHFHLHSYGFRPNCNAHQAIYQARSEIEQGRKKVFHGLCDGPHAGSYRLRASGSRNGLLNRHLPGQEFIAGLNRRLLGHYNYYGLRGNSRSLWRFYQWAIECSFKWLNRRGGKRRSFTWKAFTQALTRLGVERPRITEQKHQHAVFT